MQKFELYVKKKDGKLIPLRNTTKLAPLDKDGDRLWIRITAGPLAINHRGLRYSTYMQTPYDFGTGNKYANCDIVSTIDWKQFRTSASKGPYVVFRNEWELLAVHTTSLVHSGTTIQAGLALCKLADLKTIRESLKGTGIKVIAPHFHINVALNNVSRPISSWLIDGTKTHINEILKPTIPATPIDPCKKRIEEVMRQNTAVNAAVVESYTSQLEDKEEDIKSLTAENIGYLIKLDNQAKELSNLQSQNKRLKEEGVKQVPMVDYFFLKLSEFVGKLLKRS